MVGSPNRLNRVRPSKTRAVENAARLPTARFTTAYVSVVVRFFFFNQKKMKKKLVCSVIESCLTAPSDNARRGQLTSDLIGSYI